ncbi:hypothetical protein J6590_024759 [Homalodisca vitripennis]|nr:hypothetical protein J6590_024759 [Homalodisca vitripennis]
MVLWPLKRHLRSASVVFTGRAVQGEIEVESFDGRVMPGGRVPELVGLPRTASDQVRQVKKARSHHPMRRRLHLSCRPCRRDGFSQNRDECSPPHPTHLAQGHNYPTHVRIVNIGRVQAAFYRGKQQHVHRTSCLYRKFLWPAGYYHSPVQSHSEGSQPKDLFPLPNSELKDIAHKETLFQQLF